MLCFGKSLAQTAGLATPLGLSGASARADALGSSFMGVADNSTALFFNSAGLSGLSQSEISLHHNSYLAGTFEETLLYGFSAGSLGGFAGAFQYTNWGNIDGRDASGVSQGTFTDNDMGLSVGWGREWFKSFSIGLDLHAIQQKIADASYLTFSADLGLLWQAEKYFRLGLTYSGFGTPLNGQSLAQDLRVGASRRFNLDTNKDLLAAFAGTYEPNGVSGLQGGLEMGIDRSYFLRVGYQQPLLDNQITGFANFTAGAGVRFADISLDYAYIPYGDLGASQQLSVGYDFPNPVPVVPVTIIATPAPTPSQPKSQIAVHFELPADSAVTPGAGVSQTSDTVLESYEQNAQKHPNDSRAWRDLGIVYFRAGRRDSAIQCFEQALRLDPNDKELQGWLEKYRNP